MFEELGELNEMVAWITQNGLRFVLQIFGALFIYLIGVRIANMASKWALSAAKKAKMDETLSQFLKVLVYYLILIFTFIIALQVLGVPTTSFVAVVGAAGLAIGLALEGALSNFAAGVMLLFFRPFNVGDWTELAGIYGRVERLQIFNTVLVTLDNRTVIIPNGQVTSDPIINHSAKGKIRIDLVFGIGYEDDIRKAKEIFMDILQSHPLVLDNPAPTVDVLELADSSVNFAVRPHVDPNNYWRVHFDVTEQVKLRLDEAGISIPFPQRDVHLFQQSEN